MRYANRRGDIKETFSVILTTDEKDKLRNIALLEGHNSINKIIHRLVRKFLQDYELKEKKQ
jgi:hypothetical protein